jgi:hypothetical protein
MEPTRHRPGLEPQEEAEVEKKRRQRQQQPYASELDDRELEAAHKEERPVAPKPPKS